MDVGRETLLGGHTLEQIVEHAALVLGERGEQGSLVFAGDLAEGGEHLPAFGGEVEGVAAAIVLIAAALDETSRIQRVEQRNEAAGNHLQAGGQRLLCEAGAGAQDAQDAGMRGRESNGEQPLGEARSGMGADLSQQEGSVGAVFGGLCGASGLFHRIIVPQQNRSDKEAFQRQEDIGSELASQQVSKLAS